MCNRSVGRPAGAPACQAPPAGPIAPVHTTTVRGGVPEGTVLRTSTPITHRPQADRAPHAFGHDGPLSPILTAPGYSVTGTSNYNGDDHLLARAGPTTRGEPARANLADDQPATTTSQYVHPAHLAQARANSWPRPRAVADQYPRLAHIYEAVRATGVPNIMVARRPLPTNLVIPQWELIATGHPDDAMVLDGVRYGFPSQYWGPPRPTTETGYNHTSADAFPTQVQLYIGTELKEQALIGPFTEPPFEWVHYSPIMTRPKSGQDNAQRRIIVDLSYPDGEDINSCITKNVFQGVHYDHTLPTTDSLVDIIRAMDYEVYMFSIDIARAYRNFHSDPLDWPLMGISFAGDLLIDTALPFGARNSSLFMQKIAEYLSRAMAAKGASVLIYLDDMVGVAPNLDQAHSHYTQACELLGDLGLPLAVKKLAPPAKTIQWLGILFDADNRTLSIPGRKLEEITNTISQLYTRNAMSKREVQQLAGKINFVSRVCRPARLFMARILAYLRAHPPGYTKVHTGAKADMRWFITFLAQYNGISIMPEAHPSVIIEADSCLKGGGAVCGTQCYSYAYPEEMSAAHHISQLEAMNCLAAIRVMINPLLKGKLVEIHCDNSAAVSIYHTGRGRDTVILACARAIWAHAARIDCSLVFRHVPGVLMVVADTLSRAPLSQYHERRASGLRHDLGLTPVEINDGAYSYSAYL